MNPSAPTPPAFEYRGNIHMHTTYSDGEASFPELVAAAAGAGLDYVYVTDHNVLVRGAEEGFRQGLLTLVGQEVHDPDRQPPGNHLLCLGVEEDLTHLAADPQTLIDGVNAQGGLAFLAHPIEEFTAMMPNHYDWWDWHVQGYRGVELWNYMARFRGYTTNRWRAVLLAYFPHLFTTGPLPQMMRKWDELTLERPVVAIGGTDVHGKHYRMGPLRRCFLPYDHCARALNTHILTTEPLRSPAAGRDLDGTDPSVLHDRALLLDALKRGHCWLGYDLLRPSRGFRFWALGGGQTALMGDSMGWDGEEVTFCVSTPGAADIRLLRNGEEIARRSGETLDHVEGRPGVYRVEVWLRRWGKPRGWIFSNPIYLGDPRSEG